MFLISFGLIMSLSFGQLNAQKTNPVMYNYWATGTYWSPVYCDGMQVDVLEGGTIRIHIVALVKDGALQWEIDQIKGCVTSLTGESFMIREVDRYFFDGNWFVTWHYNLIGDQGTHYTGTLTYSYLDGSITVGNTTCH